MFGTEMSSGVQNRIEGFHCGLNYSGVQNRRVPQYAHAELMSL